MRFRRRWAMNVHWRIVPFGVLLALSGPDANAESLVAAHYADPVNRYGHFALGRPHEYARLNAVTDAGRSLALQLREDEVFEDFAPRLVRLAPDEPVELLAIVSRRDAGARLVLIGLRSNSLAISAQSPAIGTPMRWLNPVGVVDLDGDGRAEIAVVVTPHIGGPLKLYRRDGSELTEFAAMAGFSNHIYGSPELALSAPFRLAGRMHLLVPDAARLRLRVVALRNGRLFETRRCALASPVTGAITTVSAREVSVATRLGREIVEPGSCRD